MREYHAEVKFTNPGHRQTSITVQAENIEEANEKAKAQIQERFFGCGAYLESIWLHDYGRPSRVAVADAITLPEPHSNRQVCPDCAKHPQGEPSEVHDCKVLFIDDKVEIAGQCCCWSAEHGCRGD